MMEKIVKIILIGFVLIIMVGLILGFVLVRIFDYNEDAEIFCKEKGYTESKIEVINTYSCRTIDPDGRIGEWVRYRIG